MLEDYKIGNYLAQNDQKIIQKVFTERRIDNISPSVNVFYFENRTV